MRSKKKKAVVDRVTLSTEDTLPLTLQALREKAGFTAEDGAPDEFREFFSEFKFSGDPDRRTAIAMTAVDTVLRDPSMLDGTTCFGGGQIDTAVGASTVILGREKLDELCKVSGPNDLEQLGKKCAELSSDRDIKCGVMAARHLWGMFNTATRSFPSDFFRNGLVDDFQTAMLAVSSRHLGVFEPDGMDAKEELKRLAAKAEKIARLGKNDEFFQSPKGEEEVAKTALYLAKNGRFSELQNSSLLEEIKVNAEPSGELLKKIGIKNTREKKTIVKVKSDDELGGIEGTLDSATGGSVEESKDWRKNDILLGNGAFFGGRTFEEVKARWPGYPAAPAPSAKTTYWEVCSQHPATHAICCDLYRQIGQLAAAGGADEGISRAVTNKMAHHNPKFSRLILLVKLSNGKEFYVPRGRPVNWALQGISEAPFGGGEEQMELAFKKTKGRKSTVVEGENVNIESYELKAVNYSFMPWVKKAISQYLEESPFVRGPEDEHHNITTIIARPLRDAGLSFREAVEISSEVFEGIVGKASSAYEKTEKELVKNFVRSEAYDSAETELAGLLRTIAKGQLVAKPIGELLRNSDEFAELREIAGERSEQIAQTLEERLTAGARVIAGYGVEDEVCRKAAFAIAGAYPVAKPDLTATKDIETILKEAGVTVDLTKNDILRITQLVARLAAEEASAGVAFSESEKEDLKNIASKLIGAGIVVDEDGKIIKGGTQNSENLVSDYRRIATGGNLRFGIEATDNIGVSGIVEIGSIIPEIERRLAGHGAELSEELQGEISKYAQKHSLEVPLNREESFNRKAVFVSGRPASLDQALGEENGRDRYSVTSSGEKTPDEICRDYETEEVSRGGGNFLENHFAENNAPSFNEDGGAELFTPFGMAQATQSLYKVVTSKGTEDQVEMLRNFASLQVDVGGKDARKQINSMLDLVEQEDSIEPSTRGERRKFLNWVFVSVLSAGGVDDDGFGKIPGVKVGEVKQALFEKIKRHGMPGVVIVEMTAPHQIGDGLLKAKAWGYEKAGVCLPKEVQDSLSTWTGKDGGAGDLCKLVSMMSNDKNKLIEALESKKNPSALQKSMKIVLSGEKSRGYSDAYKYLQTYGGAEQGVLQTIESTTPQLGTFLTVAKIARASGVKVYAAGDERDPRTVADNARVDSIVFLLGDGEKIAKEIANFGIMVRAVKNEPTKALREHVDFNTVGVNPDGKLPRTKLLQDSRIPVAKRILMAAEAAQEVRDGV